MQEKLSFSSGVKDGIPIALGYLSVSFAFGMLAISKGLPIWSPILISATNLTGTGQFVGMGLISTGAAFVEIACTIFVINIRYMLMSLSMSQKIHEKVTLPQRFLIAFGITDEIFGVSMQKTLPLTFKYMSGLIICSYIGWVGGTTLGTLASGFLPESVISALNIALYAMFIAIIIPPARESKPVTFVIIISVIISCILNFIPAFDKVSSGWIIIICGVISSAVGAWAFPLKGGGGDE